jgi:hypothetical protein
MGDRFAIVVEPVLYCNYIYWIMHCHTIDRRILVSEKWYEPAPYTQIAAFPKQRARLEMCSNNAQL